MVDEYTVPNPYLMVDVGDTDDPALDQLICRYSVPGRENSVTEQVIELSVEASGVFRPETYGAARNGTHDDTAAIQAALDAAKANGGGIVLLSPGTYSVSANMGLVGATGVILRGAGMGSSVISDSRADETGGTGGAYSGHTMGLITWDNCYKCGVEDVTLSGALDIANLGDTHTTAAGGRKAYATYASSGCWAHRVEATLFRDEAIYAMMDSPDWHVDHCYIHHCNTNAINANCSYWLSDGVCVTNNRVEEVAMSSLQLGCKSGIASHNSFGNWTGAPTGAAPICLDIGAGNFVLSDNVMQDWDSSTSGASTVWIAGNATSETVNTNIIIANNVFTRLSVSAHNYSGAAPRGAVIGLQYEGAGYGHFLGTLLITGNLFTKIDNNLDDERSRVVLLNGLGASARVSISDNIFRNNGNGYLHRGVHVYNAAAGAVVHIGRNEFDGLKWDVTSETDASLEFADRTIHARVGATDATAAVLTKTGAAADDSNRLNIPQGDTWECELTCSVVCTAGDDAGASATWRQMVSIANVGGTTALVGSAMNLDSTGAWESVAFTPRASDAALAAATLVPTADNTNDCLTLTFTGAAAIVTPNAFSVRATVKIVSTR